MLQVAIIGLGTFGVRMLEELNDINADIIILDKNAEMINKYKDFARDAYITDAINQAAICKCIPSDLDAVIVDVGNNLEAAIMTTNYLHKMGQKQIITRAHTDEQGEVLELVGATRVIYPDLDAAQRLTPMLASNVLFNYMQVSEEMALAEVGVIPDIVDKNLIEANIRQKFDLNVVAVRKSSDDEFAFVDAQTFTFDKQNVLLVAGKWDAIKEYANFEVSEVKRNKGSDLRKMFGKKK